MKLIHYAGETFLTGDGVADALLDYATALARRARADRVELPVLSGGELGHIEIVLGPASQLVVETRDFAEVPADEVQDDEIESDIRRRTAALHNPRPVASELSEGELGPDIGLHNGL